MIVSNCTFDNNTLIDPFGLMLDRPIMIATIVYELSDLASFIEPDRARNM